MQQNDMWQEWNGYLMGRTAEFSQSVTQIYVETYGKLFSLVQEEMQRGVCEWNCLQFQKTMSDWTKMFTMPNMYSSN